MWPCSAPTSCQHVAAWAGDKRHCSSFRYSMQRWGSTFFSMPSHAAVIRRTYLIDCPGGLYKQRAVTYTECPGIHLPDAVALRATSPSSGSRVLSSSSLLQREGRIHPPYSLAFQWERGWGLEFTFGTDFTLSPGPERRGNAFSPQPKAEILSVAVRGSAFPRTFDSKAVLPVPPVRVALPSCPAGWERTRWGSDVEDVEGESLWLPSAPGEAPVWLEHLHSASGRLHKSPRG